MSQDESNYPQLQRGAHREVAEGRPAEHEENFYRDLNESCSPCHIKHKGIIRQKERAVALAVDRQSGTLRVDEFAELIRKIVREELQILLEEPSHNDLNAQPPSLREPDAIIAKMHATGKYNAKFRASLRKGRMRAQTFQKTLVESSKCSSHLRARIESAT